MANHFCYVKPCQWQFIDYLFQDNMCRIIRANEKISSGICNLLYTSGQVMCHFFMMTFVPSWHA